MALEQINNGDSGAIAATKIINNDKQIAALTWSTADAGATYPTVRNLNGVLYQVIEGQSATIIPPNEDATTWQKLGGETKNIEKVLKSFVQTEPASEIWEEININQIHYQANSYINQSFGISNSSTYDSGGFELSFLQSKGYTKLKVVGDFDDAAVVWLCGVNNGTGTYHKKVSAVLPDNEYVVNIENIYEFYGVSQLKSNTKFYGNIYGDGQPEEDEVKNYIDSKNESIEKVLKSFLAPYEIEWTLLTYPTPGDTELYNKFVGDGFGIANSNVHNVGLMRTDFLSNYDYIKMEGGMLAQSGERQWLWRQDLSPVQKFEKVLFGLINDTRIVEINHDVTWDGYGYTRHRDETKIWVGKKINKPLEEDGVYKAIEEAKKASGKTLKEKIYNGEDPKPILGFTGLSGEATVLKFKGQTLIYCTEGWLTEIITVHDYDVENNTVSNRSIVANSTTTGIPAQTFKASCFFVANQKVYMVCTTWNANSAFMMESSDGRNFSMVSTTIADVSGFKPYLYGNHWICPEKVNGYYYWFIEGTNASGVWQMKLMKSPNITNSWEVVGDIQGLNPYNGAKGGPCVYFHNGKFKMVYHYAPTTTNLPTYLAYAEANAEDPLFFKPLLMPLIDVQYTPYPITDQVADPELFEVDGKTYLISTIVDNTNQIANLHRWDCEGRLYDILQSEI